MPVTLGVHEDSWKRGRGNQSDKSVADSGVLCPDDDGHNGEELLLGETAGREGEGGEQKQERQLHHRRSRTVQHI